MEGLQNLERFEPKIMTDSSLYVEMIVDGRCRQLNDQPVGGVDVLINGIEYKTGTEMDSWGYFASGPNSNKRKNGEEIIGDFFFWNGPFDLDFISDDISFIYKAIK